MIDRITFVAELVDFFLGPILGRIAHRMPAIAISLHLEDVRPGAAARMVDRFFTGRPHRQHIHAIDPLAGNAEGFAMPVEFSRRRRALDGRAPQGALVRAILARTGADRDGLLAWCEQAGQHAYASLAPQVFATADDPYAARLLDDAARALDSIAEALDQAGSLPLVVAGSVGMRLADRLCARVRARLVTAAGDALDGALRLIRVRIAGAGASA